MPGDLQEVSHRGRAAIGMTWAKENDSAVFSFGHPPDWNEVSISARFDEINAAGDSYSTPVEIRNLSAPEHVETHREMIRNYGGDLSPSSLIHDAGGFVVRMYFYDHNPPHFHVLLHAGAQAKCAIRTLDVLAGDLPPGLLSEVRAWARIHRDALMHNWERCQDGEHPFVLGE